MRSSVVACGLSGGVAGLVSGFGLTPVMRNARLRKLNTGSILLKTLLTHGAPISARRIDMRQADGDARVEIAHQLRKEAMPAKSAETC